MTILDDLQLNGRQLEAATVPGDVVVTAGAGSGKTRTLVGRYLALLESDVPLRAIVAITFTEKAAREMRTRIRQAIVAWLAQDPPRRPFWEGVFADLDAARIGTIHSLCAQILREHPVEASRLGILPGFAVLEEGRAGVMRARAVDEALAWAAEDEAASQLFGALGELQVRATVADLLEKRLDADTAFAHLGDDPLETWAAVLRSWLAEQLETPQWRDLFATLSGLRSTDPTDKMEIARQDVLARAEAVEAALARSDLHTLLAELAALRGATSLYGRKGNWPGDDLALAKQVMRDLREYFDARLKPLANPKRPASWALDEEVAGLIWSLHATYRQAVDTYARARRGENSLDFDDLEAGALALLKDPDVRAARQAETRAVLVDEFQDTNERQREIVYALTGFDRRAAQAAPPAALFVVGDAKQSIYRFRGADVTVFRRVQDDIAHAGGRAVALDLTFRAHRPLVATTNRLLAPILDELTRPGRLYAVPFAPLEAYRTGPRESIEPPFVEFLLGLGDSAALGRQAAAEGLTMRLHALRDQEGVEWRDVALLFRASTAFSVYEDALERAGIPFVTVAGRGFYDRYEVRDLLNALLAVSDPGDDLALVGFLRSPAVGLTDAALYRLRYPPHDIVPREPHRPCSIWSVLNAAELPDIVPLDDLAQAVQGRDLIADLNNLAGRVPVATLLKRLLDRTGYRAALGSLDDGARALRNVDKLLSDAHTSGLVSVTEFLDYVRVLRDTGARESEAPTETGSAVQLMTVHKAKGLEFPIVVIADAAHGGYGGSGNVLLDDQVGVTLKMRASRGDKQRPAVYQLASLRDTERDTAENRRLLYVAATRAREKLLVSGHTKILKGGRLSLSGWLRLMGQVVGLDQAAMPGTPDGPYEIPLDEGVGCTVYPWREEGLSVPRPVGRDGEAELAQVTRDLTAPLVPPPAYTDAKLREREAHPPRRVWQVVPKTKRPQAPAWVVGTLVHTALRHWRFDEAAMDTFLLPFVLEMGVIDEREIRATLGEAKRILRRFRAHPLWSQIDAAERWHEVPFSFGEGEAVEHGVIDLLYRAEGAWTIVEFKTDRLRSGEALATHVQEEGYVEQVRRYRRAVDRQMGVAAEGVLVFLNVGGDVAVMSVD